MSEEVMKTTLLLTALSMAISASAYAQPDRDGPPRGPRGWSSLDQDDDRPGEFRDQRGQRRGPFRGEFGPTMRRGARGQNWGAPGRGLGAHGRQAMRRGRQPDLSSPSCRCPDCPVGRMMLKRFGPNERGQGQMGPQARRPRGGNFENMPRRGMGPQRGVRPQGPGYGVGPGFGPRGLGMGPMDQEPLRRGFGGPPEFGEGDRGLRDGDGFRPPRRGPGEGRGFRGRPSLDEDRPPLRDRPGLERPRTDEEQRHVERDEDN